MMYFMHLKRKRLLKKKQNMKEERQRINKEKQRIKQEKKEIQREERIKRKLQDSTLQYVKKLFR